MATLPACGTCPHPLDILLGPAVLSLLGFVYWRDRLDAEPPWFDLWPNITMDLFSVWLVRIIEAFITSRERRRHAALDVRGTMNYARARRHHPRASDQGPLTRQSPGEPQIL